MTGERIKPQVVFEITAPVSDVIWLKGKRGSEMQVALAAALLSVFGFPAQTPGRLRVKLAKSWTLLEVQGQTPAQPSPAEVRAALMAAVTCSAVLLYGSSQMENLLSSAPVGTPEQLN